MNYRHLIRNLVWSTAAATLFAWLPAQTAQAGQLPAGYPASIQAVATIDSIDLARDRLVLADHSVALADNVEIHSPYGLTGKYSLRRGMTVGVKYVDSQQGSDVVRTVTEIWILPGR